MGESMTGENITPVDLTPTSIVSVCHDRAHACCDIISYVGISDDGHAHLATYHPSNVKGEYPFRQPEVTELITAAREVLTHWQGINSAWEARDPWNCPMAEDVEDRLRIAVDGITPRSIVMGLGKRRKCLAGLSYADNECRF